MNIFAYLDPGTGSLIIQAVIGGALGIGVVAKTYWSQIVGVFAKDKKPAAKTAATTKASKSSK